MTLLSLCNVSKRFGGLMAVNNVSFEIEQRSIVGLIGPNGAGKTTLFNLITGNDSPNNGDVRFFNTSLCGMKPHMIVKLGIARTFQSIRIFHNLSLLENVLAGRHCRMRSGLLSCMFHTLEQKREEQKAIDCSMKELAFVGLEHLCLENAEHLSYGHQKLLEIARALASEPKLIILDEPAGGMNNLETKSLIRLIHAIQDRGITVLLIEHDMHLVTQVCEHVFVLEYGSVIASDTPKNISKNLRVIEAYLGQEE